MNEQLTSKKEETRKRYNYYLDGVEFFNINKTVTTYELTYELHPITMNPIRIISKKVLGEVVEKKYSYPLKEVTVEELSSLRRSNTPHLVLKTGGKLYCGRVPFRLDLVSSKLLGEPHRCSVSSQECCHLNAASDENGGCAKVRSGARYIERYDWISEGYETFNTFNDCFVVGSCSHFSKCEPRNKPSKTELEEAKLCLADFIWKGVNSREEVKRLLRRNGLI